MDLLEFIQPGIARYNCTCIERAISTASNSPVILLHDVCGRKGPADLKIHLSQGSGHHRHHHPRLSPESHFSTSHMPSFVHLASLHTGMALKAVCLGRYQLTYSNPRRAAPGSKMDFGLQFGLSCIAFFDCMSFPES